MKSNSMSPLRHAVWVLSLCAAALTVFFFTDLSIAQSVYDPDTFFGWFFDVFSPSIAPVIGMVLLCCLRISDTEQKTHPILAAAEYILAAGCAYISVSQFDKYAETDMPVWVQIVAALAVFSGGMLTAFCAKPDRKALQQLTMQAVCMIITVFVAIIVIKIIWGRQRFFTMTDPLNQFTPWLFPQGGGTQSMYKSFPSGHTGNGSALMLITLFPAAFPGLRKIRPVLYVLAGVWIPLMAFSRMVEGAHFASDVTMGFTLAYIMFCVVNTQWFIHSTEKAAAKL